MRFYGSFLDHSSCIQMQLSVLAPVGDAVCFCMHPGVDFCTDYHSPEPTYGTLPLHFMRIRQGTLAVQMLGSNDSAKNILEGKDGKEEDKNAEEPADGDQGKEEKQNGAAQVSCYMSP